MIKSCCLLGVLLMACTGTLMAQDEPTFSASASVDYFNKYVWRGMNLDNKSVLQYNMSGSAWGFTGAVWANMPLTDYTGYKAGEFNEIDYSLDYSKAIPNTDKVSFSLGIIHYTFPGTVDVDLTAGTVGVSATTEIYGGLSFNVPLNPSVTWYRDIDTIDGSYLALGVGHTFEKIGAWSDDEYISLDLSANFGVGGPAYNVGYWGVEEKTKFNDFTLNVGLPITLKHGVSITPSFHLSTILSGAIRDTYSYGEGDSANYWFGINFTKSF
jgi:hypothetical protein